MSALPGESLEFIFDGTSMVAKYSFCHLAFCKSIDFCWKTQGALTLGHLAVAVAVFTPNRAQICQCECGQANLATWERCAATVRAATVQMLMSRHTHTHGYAT